MRPPLLLSLILSVALFALASPVVKWLMVKGGPAGIVREDAISFCNVLFVGNLCAGVLVAALFNPKRIWRDVATVRGSTWWLVIASILLAVAIPTMIFTALATTMVTSLVLLSRFEPVMYTLLALVFFKTKVSRGQWLGYGLIVAGILSLVLFEANFTLMKGHLLIIGAATLQALAACLSRIVLRTCSLPAFVFLRNFVSAIVFFSIAVYFYGFGHFAEAFAGSLWIAMSIYALVIVVIGQLAWYRALAELPSSTVSKWSMLFPFFAVLFAYLLLGEIPTAIHWIAGAIIVAGMLVSRSGERAEEAMEDTMSEKNLAAA
jgi:drug/metabolite transporter (DMT)-like permease